MVNARRLAMCIAWVVISAPLVSAQDLSGYREFQIGMSLVAVAQRAGMTPSQARVLHQRPALIQELEWQPRLFDSSRQAESVSDVLFSFYNGNLFRIVVNYDRYRTEGLTAEDMVAAISARYGAALLPSTPIISYLSSADRDNRTVMAHWEDTQYSVNFFHSSYSSVTFGLVVASKELVTQARVASIEAIRLDEQEAPAREVAHQQKQAEEDRARQEKARGVNKPTFRP